jgi:hypothetical protein
LRTDTVYTIHDPTAGFAVLTSCFRTSLARTGATATDAESFDVTGSV